ncbi:hypothetical protein ACJJTC_009180 [Scirpophaga incertulas]
MVGSLTMAMRALAAIIVIAACSSRYRAYGAHDSSNPRNHDTLSEQVLTLLGVSPRSAINNAVACTKSIGPSKCLAALSIWRAENAVNALRSPDSTVHELFDDIREFPWKMYSNSSQDEVSTKLCDETEKLLRFRPLKLNMIPGYELELISKGNGTLKVDVLRGTSISRGMKKQFYNIVPYLLLPGLIMSAILPFVLPAMKLMTVAVGVLNNMALSGAVFTLLRNNAFNDRYEKKVIYVNEGYKNERAKHVYHNNHDTGAVYEIQFDDKLNTDDLEGYGTMQIEQSTANGNANVAEFNVVQELPTSNSNTDWIKKYYGLNNNNYFTFVKPDVNSRLTKNYEHFSH